jgi:hypothetical protein
VLQMQLDFYYNASIRNETNRIQMNHAETGPQQT